MNKKIRGYELRDQYFAKKEMVLECLHILEEKLVELDIDSNEYTYIEPSAGDGAFLNELPKNRRIGIDIEPRHDEVIKSDFLEWSPEIVGKYITIGGPPFGVRGKLAVKFMNYASKFSDVVAFILPEYLVIENSHYCGDKVKNLSPVHTQKLNSVFLYPNGEEVTVPIKIFFQIWIKE